MNDYPLVETNMLLSSHRNRVVKNWYVGSIVFFFEHTVDEQSRFLLLVALAEENMVVVDDVTMPKVKLYGEDGLQKYAVIRFEDIVCSVSLVKTKWTRTFHVISKHIFKQNMELTAGSVSNL